MVKITMIGVDWKEQIPACDINRALNEVKGERFLADVRQQTVDMNLMVASSIVLTEEQVTTLYNEGDLCVCDRVWRGKSYKDILNKVKKYAAQQQY